MRCNSQSLSVSLINDGRDLRILDLNRNDMAVGDDLDEIYTFFGQLPDSRPGLLRPSDFTGLPATETAILEKVGNRVSSLFRQHWTSGHDARPRKLACRDSIAQFANLRPDVTRRTDRCTAVLDDVSQHYIDAFFNEPCP